MKHTRLPTQHEIFERKLTQAHSLTIPADRPLIVSMGEQIDEIVARSPAAVRRRRAKPSVVATKVVRFFGHGIRNDDGK